MRFRVPLLIAALSALVLPAGAPAATARSSAAKIPVVKKVSPLRLAIGERMTISGRNFTKGRRKNTVVFQARRGPAVFVRADRATRTRIRLVVPDKLARYLRTSNGASIATRFRIRVLAKRFARAFTATRRSPVILPAGSAVAEADCDKDGIANGRESDDDNDLLTDAREREIGTDPCLRDTDTDGLEDGFEHESALDLNSRAIPYPGKRPYPNALDPSDAAIDHDGDGLTAADEHQMWLRFGGHALPLTYSDGTQYSGGPKPAPVAPPPGIPVNYVDMDGNGLLTDDEKDVDGDGLTNWDERYGRNTQGWWDSQYKKAPKETRYPLTFLALDFVDPDTDGDGVRDGADDQDHDGYTNAFETARPWDWALTYVSSAHSYADRLAESVTPNVLARVQPFNPCKPHDTVVCHKHPPFEYYEEAEDWFSPAP